MVVADGSRARFFENLGPGRGLSETAQPDLAAETKPTRALGTDEPGRTHDRFGPTGHSMTPRVDWHEFEKAAFAREVASLIDRAAEARKFDRLVLVAPAKTLGELRASLSKKAAGLVSGELGKDLTKVPIQDLPSHIGAVLAV